MKRSIFFCGSVSSTVPSQLLCLAVLALGLVSAKANAQTNEWTWAGGSDAAVIHGETAPPGVYGTLGVAAPGNIPGARSGAVSWTDPSGNLWLFGGEGIDSGDSGSSDGSTGRLNDMWKFNPSTLEWTWMGGSSKLGAAGGVAGVYGTLGVAAAGNIPGGRSGAVSWVDPSGNFWLFGGIGFDAAGTLGDLNDLWEFSPSLNQWTWISGSSTVGGSCTPQTVDVACGQTGVYGTLGTPAAGNTPGGRQSAMSWIDASGDLWLFGGLGFDSIDNQGNLNDLWEFNPSTAKWSWMSGSSTLGCANCGQPGVYGTLGTPAAGNVPGGRNSATAWVDGNGNFWLYGGYGYSASGSAFYLNDLWEFNPSTQLWGWMGGNSSLSDDCAEDTCGFSGVYGTLGVPDSANLPGYRDGACSWAGSGGDVWFFGGTYAFTVADTVRQDTDVFNDLWLFSPSTNEWAWWNGSNFSAGAPLLDSFSGYVYGQPGVYGTLDTPAVGNSPGGRSNGACWTDLNGNLWLFGGSGADMAGNDGLLNDLWEYVPSAATLPPAITPVFATPSGSYTSPIAVQISDEMTDAVLYYTTDGSEPGTGSNLYTGAIGVSTTETIKAIATAAGYSNSAVISATYTFPASVATPTFSVSSGTYSSAQTVTLSDSTTGAMIYYTTNGTTPTTGSTVYNGAILVSATETIKAIAAEDGSPQSAVASATYTIDIAANPAPVLGTLSPAYTSAGGATFTLTVNGSGFTSGSTVYWGTTALTTTFVSASRLTASVTAAEIASTGAVPITVQTPAPGGGTSSAMQFEVDSASVSSYVPGFTATTATISAGATGTFPVTLSSSATNVTVSCLNLPTGASCSYSASSGTVTIATTSATPPGTYQITVVFTETVPASEMATLLLPVLLVPLLFLRRRRMARGIWLTSCLGLLLFAGATLVTSCSGGTVSPTPTSQTVSSAGAVTLTIQ